MAMGPEGDEMVAAWCEKREGTVSLGGGWPMARDSSGDGALSLVDGHGGATMRAQSEGEVMLVGASSAQGQGGASCERNWAEAARRR